MCDLNSQFTLCTCEEKDLRGKTHWLLYRYDESRTPMMGITHISNYHENFSDTSHLILQELNNRYCFDKPISIRDRDELVIVTKTKDKKMPTAYFAFQYRKGKWRKGDYDMMHLGNRNVKREKGIVK